jgi:DNA (cytosine-5)-methyltransferase 1
MKSANPHSGIYVAESARTLDNNGGNPACNQGGMAIVQPICVEMTSTKNTIVEDGICPKLTARMGTGGNQVNAVCISGDDVADTLDASYYKGCGERGFKERTVVADRAAVRRLTPLECERLQGYPDGWTDIGEWVDSKGKRHQTTDSARYKALGNSIALPYWRYLLKRISAQFEYTPTMASLFDGIGGFPYLWEGINGKGTCLWASEIEEFPMAVTKLRIGE